jgi:hypothetical protein
MNQQQAFEAGYQVALRSMGISVKEETTDYRVEQVNMMLQDLKSKWEKYKPLMEQAQSEAEDIRKQFDDIRNIIYASEEARDKNTPIGQLGDMISKTIYFILSYRETGLAEFSPEEILGERGKQMDDGFSKLGV